MTEKLKVAYTALPRVTPPHATNCLLERMGGTSPARPGAKRAADGMAGFPESSEMTSPLRVTSYWGPDGSTKMVRRLEHRRDRKRSEPRLWGGHVLATQNNYKVDSNVLKLFVCPLILTEEIYSGLREALEVRWTSAMWGTPTWEQTHDRQKNPVYICATSCRHNQSPRFANRIRSNRSLD